MWPTRLVLLLSFSLVAWPAPSSRSPNPGPGAVMGWWHGTSTCVKASWNSACNDEIITYNFVPTSPDSSSSNLIAYKIVNGKRDLMGELPVTFAADSQRWNADFANSRVSIRWSYWLHGDTLLGQVAIRPDMKVGRQVVAFRGALP